MWRLIAVSPRGTVWLLAVLYCTSNVDQFLAKLLSVFNIFFKKRTKLRQSLISLKILKVSNTQQTLSWGNKKCGLFLFNLKQLEKSVT